MSADVRDLVVSAHVDASVGSRIVARRRRPRIRFPRVAGHATLLASVAVLAIILLWAVVPGVFAPFDPLRGDATASLHPPSWEHPFGTDRLGRDLFSRVVHGTTTTLAATLVAVTIGGITGSLLGLLSGYLRGWFDVVTMRLIDVLLAIPGLLLAMTVVTALGYGTFNIALAVGIAAIPAFARVMRSEVLRVAHSDFVDASVMAGGRRLHILRKHLLPNASPAVLSLAALEFGSAILSVAALGFLGYGAPPPHPEWGLAVVEGRDQIATHPWLALLPGLVIAAAVLSTNRISRALAERP